MLQVYIYGEKESGFMDLYPDTKLQMEQLKDIFDTEFGKSDYSIPLEAEWTEGNKRKFNFAERLSNTSDQVQYWQCDVISDGLPVFYRAKITILEKNGLLSYRRGKFNFSISGSKGLLGSRIANKYLTDLAMGGAITFPVGNNSRQFAYNLMQGTYPQYDYLRFVPVQMLDFFDTARSDSADEFLAKDLVNCVVINSAGSDWVFGRPDPDDEHTAVTSGEFYINYRTIPFLKVKFILQSIFEEAGYKLTGSFMTTTDFDDLLLHNNYAIEHYNYESFGDSNQTINPQNHVPKMLQADFVKAVCSFFNMYPAFVDASTVELRYRENVLKQKKTAIITNYVSTNFISEITEITGKGINIQYTGNSTDSYLGERVQDLTNYTICATVFRYTDLATLSIGRSLTTSDVAYVIADNMYYRVANATGMTILWDAFSEHLEEYKTDDGAITFDVLIKPLAQAVVFNDTSALYERKNYVGGRMKGSYRVKTGAVVMNDFGLNIFYGKMYEVDGLTQPISFTHNRDANNVAMVKYSLSLHPDDGIVKTFFSEWITVKQVNELIKTKIMLDEKVLSLLNNNEYVMIDNIRFLQSKLLADYPVSKNKDAELQLYIA